jgi:uncharacterized protein
MAKIAVHDESITLESPVFVEGLPGVGLVGKIAADHLVAELDMDYYAAVECDGVPDVAVYEPDDPTVQPPVRLYADAAHDLVVLQSDVPVSAAAATDFAGCLTGWLADADTTPIYLVGLPTEKGADVPGCYGVATGDGATLLGDLDLEPPGEAGIISGPTGALLDHARSTGLTGVGGIVESDPRFPDPEAARVLLDRVIEPLADIDVSVDSLVDRAEDIREQKDELAERMQDAEEGSTRARRLGMYH